MEEYDPDKLASLIEKITFDGTFVSFYNYLETISGFLSDELEKIDQRIAQVEAEIDDKIESGEIVVSLFARFFKKKS